MIRKVRSRLKLIKNKRSCIVQHLRDDIAILLKHGHHQPALDRAEQLFKDECELTVYTLLDNFCEFIIVNFSYIRKLKECNNDIKEAVSTLIFASARFGDLHELKKIRELFRDRFGKTFATISLELLTGNLVNQQMKDFHKKCIGTVPVEVKFRLVSEIAGNFLKSGPLLIDYPAQPQHYLKAEECSDDETQNGDIVITDSEAKIVNIDSSSKTNNHIKDHLVSLSVSPPLPNDVASSFGEEYDLPCVERVRNEENGVVYNGVSQIVKSLSESSGSSAKEMAFVDDIEEFVSSVGIEGDIQDQRVFMFSPSNGESRGRLRKRSISLERSCMIDSGSAIYYGDSSENSNRRKHLKKRYKCKKTVKCSKEHPCYLCNTEGGEFIQDGLYGKETFFIQQGNRCAVSMPQPERCFKNVDHNHVHPKLPDYDDLATKFIALKKAYLECSQ